MRAGAITLIHLNSSQQISIAASTQVSNAGQRWRQRVSGRGLPDPYAHFGGIRVKGMTEGNDSSNESSPNLTPGLVSSIPPVSHRLCPSIQRELRVLTSNLVRWPDLGRSLLPYDCRRNTNRLVISLDILPNGVSSTECFPTGVYYGRYSRSTSTTTTTWLHPRNDPISRS